LASVREESIAALVLRGAPGIGKTALLAWTIEAAAPMRSVAIHCTREDAPTRWSTTRALVAQLEDSLPELLPWQVERLTGAVSDVVPIDPLTVGAALTTLVSQVSRDTPLLVVIDNAHWADSGSRDALRFLARSIRHEHVVLVLAVDEGGSDGFSDVLPVMDIGGLSPIDAAELLDDPIDTRVAEQLARITDGNPLAMLEIAAQMSDEQRAGAAPIGSVLPLGEELLRGFARQTERLSPDQRRLLLLVAADSELDEAALRTGARHAGLDPALIPTLVRPGLLVAGVDGRIRFSRPLQREAIYQEAGPDARRAMHAVLAVMYATTTDQHARHLAAAAARGPDHQAAEALESMAARALGRGDPAAAGASLLRAAELSDSLDGQVRRLTGAGSAFSLADDNRRAIESFDRALMLTSDPGVQAEILIARAAPRLATDPSARGYQELTQIATRVETTHPAQATWLRSLASMSALATGRFREARRLCRETLERAPAAPSQAVTMTAALAARLLVLSGAVEEGLGPLFTVDPPDPRVWLGRSTLVFEDLVANALAWLGEFSASSRLTASLVDESRAANAVGVLARALGARADLYVRTGHWDAALADANEAYTLARELGSHGVAALALGLLARLEAGRGSFADARRHGFEALELTQQLDLIGLEFWTRGALGFVALSEGRGPEAVGHLEAARAFAEREEVRLLVAVPWAPDLVEAYARVGRMDEARRLVSELDDQGAARQGALPAAFMARSRGLVTSGDAYEEFATAINAHKAVAAPFERARTLLLLGERLRRDRRAAQAVTHLEEAAVAFARLGATPWGQRANAELEAEGKLAPSAPREGRRSLTPQEFRIALAVARGGTNREVAGSLYLSPRTVEHHLANVYRKLGVRSRSELARRVTTDPEFNVELDSAER
jgi:DNA-binding CsgD family transcriptional regulator